MKMTRLHLIAAARPNFMKIAPLYHALLKESWADTQIVHTGQHYDRSMSDSFFEDLELPDPHVNIGVGSGTHAEQTAKVMIGYEKLCQEQRPDLVVVVGDVNSTMACALVAAKLHIPVAHLEAGLRSFDRRMPEEVNRLVTDSICDLLWTPSADGDENLIREGVPTEKIELVGNIMIDSLEFLRPKIEKENMHGELGLEAGSYGVLTFHRPSNVDDPAVIQQLCNLLKNIAQQAPLVFPVHPRTKKSLEKLNLLEELENAPGLVLSGPLPYRKFMSLLMSAKFVLTDSGGIQEETTYLGIPCRTLRENTERPITITQGTNRLSTLERAEADIQEILSQERGSHQVPELWDGKTAGRVVDSIRRFLS